MNKKNNNRCAKIYNLLEEKAAKYNGVEFIARDPISIPHRFTRKQDIEIAGFLTATISWGNRVSIIQSAGKLMQLMDNSPHAFILSHTDKDLKHLLHFKHRTFQPTDLFYFIRFLQHHYTHHSSLEDAFLGGEKVCSIEEALRSFHQYFFSLKGAPQRTQKHLSTPDRNSRCKRLNMFLRWMVRNDNHKVDFGLWKRFSPSQLLIPLDVHVDKTARQLGLINRKQSDWKTVLELTEQLRQFDPEDPVKYDYALFGLSALDKIPLP